MNWDQIEDNWEQLKANAKQDRSKHSHDQFNEIDVKQKHFATKTQENYKIKGEVEKRLQDWQTYQKENNHRLFVIGTKRERTTDE